MYRGQIKGSPNNEPIYLATRGILQKTVQIKLWTVNIGRKEGGGCYCFYSITRIISLNDYFM